MTPDITTEEGFIDVKTVKKRDGSIVEFDTTKLIQSMTDATAISIGRNGKSMVDLYHEMYQTMAIPSIHMNTIGGFPSAQMVTAQSRSRRIPREEIRKKYSVSKRYPYSVSKTDIEADDILIWFERYQSEYFDNRFRAEHWSLVSLINYQSKIYHNIKIESTRYKRRDTQFTGYNNSLKSKQAKRTLDTLTKRLDNLEEEHPEWLI